jgi:hypothetical protein
VVVVVEVVVVLIVEEDEDDDVLGVVGLVVVDGVVVMIVVDGGKVVSGFKQLFGLATRPLNKPTTRIHPRPPAIPATRMGAEISRALRPVLTPIILELNN